MQKSTLVITFITLFSSLLSTYSIAHVVARCPPKVVQVEIKTQVLDSGQSVDIATHSTLHLEDLTHIN